MADATAPSGHTEAYHHIMRQVATLGLRHYDGLLAEAVLGYMEWLLASDERRKDELFSCLPNLFDRARIVGIHPVDGGSAVTLGVPGADVHVWFPSIVDLLAPHLDEAFREGGRAPVVSVNVVADPRPSPAQPDGHFEHDRMFFQRRSEVAVYEGLKRMQRGRPMLVIPNARVRPPGPYRIPDFVVIIDGKAAAIEVDGSSHQGRRDQDNVRDQYLEDNGLAFVRHISEADAFDEDRCQQFLDRFVERLERHRA